MSREEIDILWQKALSQSVKDGEQFTRYHFAALVAAAEREAIIGILEQGKSPRNKPYDLSYNAAIDAEIREIRARGTA